MPSAAGATFLMGSTSTDREAWAAFIERRQQGKPIEKVHKRTPADLHHQIQRTFTDWVRIMEPRIPKLKKMYAIPNGGWRHPAVGGKLKAEGVRRGIPDKHMAVAVDPWHSLYLEVKTPDDDLSEYQKERRAELMEEGNVVAVCWSVDDLINTTLAYLAGAIIDAEGTISPDWRRDR